MHNTQTSVSGVEFHKIGERYKHAAISKLDFGEDTCKIILEWMQREKNIFLFEGTPGVGKTYLCAAIVNHWYEKKKEIRYFTARSYLERVRFAISNNQDAIGCVHHICESEYLIIDDMGSNLSHTDWQSEIMFETIDCRYNSKLPTIITTNLTRRQIEEIYTERTGSRLYASDNLYVKLNAPDRRAQENDCN
jgi:DNA replication protein DnaC